MNEVCRQWLVRLKQEGDIPISEMPDDLQQKMLREALIETGFWLSSGEIVRISAYGKIILSEFTQA